MRAFRLRALRGCDARLRGCEVASLPSGVVATPPLSFSFSFNIIYLFIYIKDKRKAKANFSFLLIYIF